MDDKKSTSPSRKDEQLPATFLQKDWVKRLEEASGKPLNLQVRKFGRVYLLLDCSASMTSYNKLEQAKSGAEKFAEDALEKGYAVGLIKFETTASHLLDPNQSLEEFKIQLKNITATGGTNMTAAIKEATRRFSEALGERVIYVVTDGMPDDRNSTLEAANEAKAKGIEIMTFGTDDADKSFLDLLATRKELSVKVSRDKLQQGIASMAKLLPDHR